MKKQIGFFICMACCLTLPTNSYGIFKESLDGFITRMSKDVQEREGFRAYYSDFLDRQSRLSTKRRRQKLRRLRSDALSSLQIKHEKHYKALADHSELDLEGQTRNTRLFLVRYRLFEDYLQHKNTKHVYLLNKAQIFISDVSKKLSSLTGIIRDKFTRA